MGLRDPKQEDFAVRIGSGGEDVTEAFYAVYGEDADANDLPVLLAEPSLCQRIGDLQEERSREVQKRTVLSEVWLLDKLKDGIEGAYGRGQFGAMRSMIELAARHPALNGVFSQRVEHTHHHDILANMSWDEQFEAAKRLGLVKSPAKGKLPPGEADKLIEASYTTESEEVA